jgi:hypothetical protein
MEGERQVDGHEMQTYSVLLLRLFTVLRVYQDNTRHLPSAFSSSSASRPPASRRLTLLLVSSLVMIVQVPSGVFLTLHLDPRQLSMSLNQGRSESEDGESDGEFVEHRKRRMLFGWSCSGW